MIRVCLVGGLGRMGKAIGEVVQATDDVIIASVWERAEAVALKPSYQAEAGYTKSEVLIAADGYSAAEICDVMVDFSSPAVFDEIVKVAKDLGKPLVTGTTGIESKRARLRHLAQLVAVVDSPNMAVGVNVLFDLVGKAGTALAGKADVEIVETHHRTKQDAPSGTAIRLASILSEIAGTEVISEPRGPRHGNEIRVHSLRMGSVPGVHSVSFALEGEVLEMRHTALSRLCFASGAVRAAFFASKASPGLYDMRDVLGLR